jgi:uncharacterized protein YbjT (DUF2867 family)
MNTTLITGGTGKTGRRVAELLTSMGHPIKIGSRSGHTRFDWEDKSTWAPALDDCTSAYITFAPDLAFPGAAGIVGEFARTAVATHTTRLVLLSGRGEEGAQLAERLVTDSGADWTVVRCAFFAQNFSEGPWVNSIRSGHLELPGNTAEPILDAEDIAEVVAATLTEDRHVGKLYELTGPRLMTFDQMVKEIGVATGRDLGFREVSSTEFATGLQEVGTPADMAQGLAALFAEVLDGHNAYLSDGARRAIGHDPRDFTGYVRRAAATGVWNG